MVRQRASALGQPDCTDEGGDLPRHSSGVRLLGAHVWRGEAGMNAEYWGHRPSPRQRTAVRVSSGPPGPPPCPTRRQRAGVSPAMPGNAAAAGLAGGQGRLLPGGRWKGAARVEGASSCLILSPGAPSPGRRGPGTDLFPAVPSLGSGNPLIRGRGEAQTGWGGGEGRRGGSGSASAAPPTTRQEPRRLFLLGTRTQALPGTPLLGSFEPC